MYIYMIGVVVRIYGGHDSLVITKYRGCYEVNE